MPNRIALSTNLTAVADTNSMARASYAMPQTHFECALCLEDKLEAYPRLVDGSRICDACANESVKPLFLAALAHEHQYPPMWGKEKLDVWTFWDLFDDNFKDSWRIKEREYAVSVKMRLYCEHRDGGSGIICSEFLGNRGSGLVICSRCRHHTCRACGASEKNAASPGRHACKKDAAANPFEKLQKGHHYQQCPGCEKEYLQGDGCNHMTCGPPCGTHFCFICGKQVAARRSGHWQRGGCPRFGLSGSRRIWDNPDEHSEAGSEVSDDNNNDAGDFIGHLRDVARIEQMFEMFDHTSDTERMESNRMRIIRGVPSLNSEYRIRFLGYVTANLSIVLRVMRTRFDVDEVPDLLTEFLGRHQRINEMYRFSRDNAEARVGTVTELADLSEEFESYFAFALETIMDLEVIAAALQRRP